MKVLLKSTLLSTFLFLFLITNAQKLKLTQGDLAAVQGQTAMNFEFTYDNMAVGKFDQEKDYIAKKTEEFNKKEAGRGDTWAKSWVADRQSRFEPKFIELFTKSGEMTESKTAKYTLVLKTQFTEPGFNIGLLRKNAQINGIVQIVETANRNNVIAEISVDKALGRTFGGFDYDTGLRISEAYADAGKALGKFVKKS